MKRKIGKYTIIEKIGRGGMGEVYKAIEPEERRLVAIKVIRADCLTSSKALKRFQREIRMQTKLDHPNIARIFEGGEIDGRPYFVMEYIKGTPLSKAIPLTGMDIEIAAHIAQRIAFALEYIHSNNIIHRDLKPANILINSAGHPHIMDFGLAKMLDSDEVQVTRAGAFLGTVAYSAPEQVKGEISEIDQRSDIFSLCTVFYQMLTGRRPFEAQTEKQERLRIIKDDPKPPRKYRRAIPPELETICLKGLNKEKDRRYAHAKEIALELERYFQGKALLTKAEGPFDRLVRLATRHKLSSLSVVICLFLLFGVSLYMKHQFHKEQNRLQAQLQSYFKRAQAALALDDYRTARYWLRRVLENDAQFPGAHKLMCKIKHVSMLHLKRYLHEGRKAFKEKQWIKASRYFTQIYLEDPQMLRKAGFFFIKDQWMDFTQARAYGYIDPEGKRQKDQFWFGGTWLSPGETIRRGYLYQEPHSDRWLLPREAARKGYYFINNTWLTAQKASQLGYLYFDQQQQEWISPEEANQRGFFFFQKRWMSGQQAQAEGYIFWDGHKWLTPQQAIAKGFIHLRLKKCWCALNSLWHKRLHRTVLPKHSAEITAVRFIRHGKVLITGTSRGDVFFWDLSFGREIFSFKALEGKVHYLDLSPDEKWLATLGSDQNLQVWPIVNLASVNRQNAWRPIPLRDFFQIADIDIITKNEQPFVTLLFVLDASRVALRFHPARRRKQVVLYLGNNIYSAAFGPLAQKLAFIEEKIKIWDLAKGRVIHQLPHPLGESRFATLAFFLDKIVAVGHDDNIQILAESGKVLQKIKAPSKVLCLDFADNGKAIAVGTKGHQALVWQIRDWD